MSQDNDRESTPTDAAPPPSQPDLERPTQPPGASDADASRALSTMLPPGADGRLKGAAKPPSDFFELAYNTMLEIREAQKQQPEVNDDLVRRLSEAAKSASDANRKTLNDKLDTIAANVESTARDVQHLIPRVATIETKVDSMQRELAALRQQVDEQERDLLTTKRLIVEAEERWRNYAARAADSTSTVK